MSEHDKGDGFKEYREHHNGLTWRDYVDLRFADADKALSYAKKEMDRRLEGMNGFQHQIDAYINKTPTKESVDAVVDRLNGRILSNERAIASLDKNTERRITEITSEKKAYVTIISIAVSAVVSITVGIIITVIAHSLK